MKSAEEYFKSRSPNGRDILPFVAISMDDYVQICNDARNSAFAEAAEAISDWAKAWRGAHMNTNDVCGVLKRDVLALGNSAYQPKKR